MELTKLKKQTGWLAVICLIILCLFGFNMMASLSTIRDSVTMPIALVNWISHICSCITVIIIMGNTLLMLYGITKEDSPFTLRNVRRLQWLGWALIACETIHKLSAVIVEQIIFAQAQNGDVITVTRVSFGGMLIVVGLAVLCIARVFRYGVKLQIQADETL